MNRLAVLITVHNRCEKTLSSLKHLYNNDICSGLSIDVYMTDDGCTDNTVNCVLNNYPDVIIIKGDGNLFWNRGMWHAWSAAEKGKYDFYLWLNDDTYLAHDSLRRLLEESGKQNHNCVIVGSTTSSEDPKHVTYGGRDKNGILQTDINVPHECDTFNGNIVLIPHKVFKAVGKNDYVFLHGLGDFDYGLRVKHAGFKSIVAKGSFGICDLHKSMPLWCNPNVGIAKRWKNFFSPLGANPFNFFVYKSRHFGVVPATLTFVSNFIHVLFPSLWHNKNNPK